MTFAEQTPLGDEERFYVYMLQYHIAYLLRGETSPQSPKISFCLVQIYLADRKSLRVYIMLQWPFRFNSSIRVNLLVMHDKHFMDDGLIWRLLM